jgi:two-component system alkaline phosphatase synthesis response regulator PhoP
MNTPKILVIDDESSILNLVTSYLRAEEYEYYTASDGPSGLKAAQTYKPDLIVLDIMLPGMDGIEVLSQLRRESDVYVIMLTAKSEETDKVIGLSVGADDYLTKPFSPRELMARIKAALRRMRTGINLLQGEIITTDHLRIDPVSRQVWDDDELIELTSTEFDLLLTLAEHRGMVLSREQLLEKVWGHDYFGEIRVVDVHLGHVRQKLGDHHSISTVRGIGYRFEKERT